MLDFPPKFSRNSERFKKSCEIKSQYMLSEHDCIILHDML